MSAERARAAGAFEVWAARGEGALPGATVLTDGQTGYRAFSCRALEVAEIRHDYNYAQVLTLSLWGAGIEPVEV